MKNKSLQIIGSIILVFLLFYSNHLVAQNNIELALNTSPSQVGEKIVENLVSRRFSWRYHRVCSYYGSLIFTDAIKDTSYLEQFETGYSKIVKRPRMPRSGHVDFNVFGIWPFEMYQQTGNEAYLATAKKLADDEYKNPRDDGLTELTRFWVDDMYMVGSLQIQAYKALKEKKYLDRAAQQVLAYCDSLQRQNGLFFHRSNAPFYWGRGNGWAAAAMTEVLIELPKDHKLYPALLESFQKMMTGLLKYQGKDGMWHQLLDYSDSYAETSCTGMFLYALASGIENGWLSSDMHLKAVEKGWNSLSNYVNEDGEVSDVCMWTNAKNRENHYLKRRRKIGDFHGQAAVLWASTAIVKLLEIE